MKIRTKLLMIAGAPLAVAVAVGVVHFGLSGRVNQAQHVSDVGRDVMLGAVELNMLTHEFVHDRAERSREQWETRFLKLHEEMANATVPQGEQEEILERVRRDLAGIGKDFEELTAEPAASSQSNLSVEWKRRLQRLLLGKSRRMANEAAKLSRAGQAQLRAVRATSQTLIMMLTAVLLVVVALVSFSVNRTVSDSVARLRHGAETVAAANLDHVVQVASKDELGELSKSFNDMTGRLRASRHTLEKEIAQRRSAEQTLQQSAAELEATVAVERETRDQIESLVTNIKDAVRRLSSTSGEILCSTSQQCHDTEQQASVVSETMTTVEQLSRLVSESSEQSSRVADAARHSVAISNSGTQAVRESVQAMHDLKVQVQSIAENILSLAKRSQAIKEIIAAVADIAEQINVLALNAAVEASRAGEHGRGFAVVATEIKSLAEQSKKATVQVRQMLSEIQDATNKAVLSTEQGTNSVTAAAEVVAHAGPTIDKLGETISESERMAAQIAASARQQATGVTQLSDAVRSIDHVAQQNLAAIRQIELAARDLYALSSELAELTQ